MNTTVLGVLAQVVDVVQVGAKEAASAAPPAGRIQGGWGYVWASYAITWSSLVLYSLSLWWRRPKALPKE